MTARADWMWPDPRRSAVLVVDKQRAYFGAGRPGVTPARVQHMSGSLDHIDRFIAACRDLGVPIIWTQMAEDPACAPANLAPQITDEWAFSVGSADWEIVGLQPTAGEAIIRKQWHDAFTGTSLDHVLDAQGAEALIIVGGYAGRCVLATAFAAASRGYFVVVPNGLVLGCVNSPDEEGVVNAVISDTIGRVVDPEVLLAEWSSYRAGCTSPQPTSL